MIGDKRMVDARTISKYIINRCTLDNKPVSDLQLQKILYYIQVNFYRQFNAPAFLNRIVAKKYGPVVSDVYDEYRLFGAMPITLLYSGVEDVFNEEEKKIVDWVTDACREKNPWDLVRISHAKGGPWDQTMQECEIDQQKIREYALKGL